MSSNPSSSAEYLAIISATLNDMYRPRVFFDILPGKRNQNLLDGVLKNSGGSPAYNINCSFDPDLKYYDNTIYLAFQIASLLFCLWVAL